MLGKESLFEIYNEEAGGKAEKLFMEIGQMSGSSQIVYFLQLLGREIECFISFSLSTKETREACRGSATATCISRFTKIVSLAVALNTET